MASRRGGYLGGSTIINTSKASGPADEGPVAALERARIDNRSRETKEAEKQRERSAADARLTVVEDLVYEIGQLLDARWLKEPVEPRLEIIRDFVDGEAVAIAMLGPGQNRRSKIIQDDFHVLLKAADANEPQGSSLLWKTTIFPSRENPKVDAFWRNVRAISRDRSR